MRLSNQEVKIIKEVVSKYLKDYKIYLFGSRLDNAKKGGDIDLFIISKEMDYEKRLKIEAKLEMVLQKPVDIVYHKDFKRDIEKEALKGKLL